MDTGYRAVYWVRNNTKGARQHDGAIDSNLDAVQTLASGIVKHWPSVVTATVYAHPSRKPIATYSKDGGEIRYA